MKNISADQDDFATFAKFVNPGFAPMKARLSKQMDGWMAQQGDRGIPAEMEDWKRQGAGGREEDDAEVRAKASANSEAAPAAKPQKRKAKQ